VFQLRPLHRQTTAVPPLVLTHKDRGCRTAGLTAFKYAFCRRQSPVVTALLHGSCCWLPVRGKRATVSSLVANSLTSKGLLDLLTVGSASVATVHRLRPFLLTITVVLLADSLRRRGPTYRNIVQVTLCGVLLLLPRLANSVGKMGTVTAPTRSCH